MNEWAEKFKCQEWRCANAWGFSAACYGLYSTAVGGLVGNSYSGSIGNAYATGNVTGLHYVGGLLGNSTNSYIYNTYSSGAVNGMSYVGGHIGFLPYGNVQYNGYWDVTTSGMSVSNGGTGLTTSQMKIQSSYADPGLAGFDFVNTWVMLPGNNYPTLRNNPVRVAVVIPPVIVTPPVITTPTAPTTVTATVEPPAPDIVSIAGSKTPVQPTTRAGSTIPGIGDVICNTAGCRSNNYAINIDHFLLGKNWFANLIWPTTTSDIKDGVVTFQNQKPVAVTAVIYDSISGKSIEIVIPPNLGSGPISVVSDLFETPINGAVGFVDSIINGGATTFDVNLPAGFDLSNASITYKIGDIKSTVTTCFSIAANALNIGMEVLDTISNGEIPVENFKNVVKDVLKNAASDGVLIAEYSSILLSTDSAAIKAVNILDISNSFLVKEIEKKLISIGLAYYSNELPDNYLKQIKNISGVLKTLKVAAALEKTLDIVTAVNFLSAFPDARVVELDKISYAK